jgi:putative holliday junction resolvase
MKGASYMRSAKTLEYPRPVRWLGVDLGRRRIGLALSDSSASLARPWKTVAGGTTAVASADAVVLAIRQFAGESLDDSGIEGVVVGLPRRLGGEDNEQTSLARATASLLGERTGLPVELQDERLTSREAEELVSARERDWRKRKALIDAMAAAIILQDFLDGAPGRLARRPASDD